MGASRVYWPMSDPRGGAVGVGGKTAAIGQGGRGGRWGLAAFLGREAWEGAEERGRSRKSSGEAVAPESVVAQRKRQLQGVAAAPRAGCESGSG